MRKYRYLAVAPAALLAALVAAMPASAANNVLTVGSAGGNAVASGDSLNASLASGTQATFFSSATGTTGVRCTTSTFNATAGSNPAAPGTATESLTGQAFSGCTANVFGVSSVKSITVTGLPYAATVSSSGAAGLSGTIGSTVVLGTVFGDVTCKYATSSFTGTASKTSGAISFANQSLAKTSGPNICFNTVFFSASYGPVRDASQGNGQVFVN